jgi:hypothetical protein
MGKRIETLAFDRIGVKDLGEEREGIYFGRWREWTDRLALSPSNYHRFICAVSIGPVSI